MGAGRGAAQQVHDTEIGALALDTNGSYAGAAAHSPAPSAYEPRDVEEPHLPVVCSSAPAELGGVCARGDPPALRAVRRRLGAPRRAHGGPHVSLVLDGAAARGVVLLRPGALGARRAAGRAVRDQERLLRRSPSGWGRRRRRRVGDRPRGRRPSRGGARASAGAPDHPAHRCFVEAQLTLGAHARTASPSGAAASVRPLRQASSLPLLTLAARVARRCLSPSGPRAPRGRRARVLRVPRYGGPLC